MCNDHTYITGGNNAQEVTKAHAQDLTKILLACGPTCKEALANCKAAAFRRTYISGVAHGIYDLLMSQVTGKPLIEDVLITEARAEIIESMSWMVEDMKTRFNEQKSSFGFENDGGYSPELEKAIELLERLKEFKA